MEVRRQQPQNAPYPIFVTELGMLIEVMAQPQLKALSDIFVTPSFIITDLIFSP